MNATVTGLGATDTVSIVPGYPLRAWPVNLEDRPHVRVSSVVCPNGSVAATCHGALSATLARCVLEEWAEIRRGRS